MQCNAMKKITINQGEWYRPIGILAESDEWKMCSSYQLVRLRGLGYVVDFLSRDVISDEIRWWMQLDGLSNLPKKITAKCRAYLKETEAQHTATPPSMA